MTEAMMTETTMESIMDGLETDDLADDRWTPDSDQQADWCLRKIREAQEDKARWKEFYQEQMRRAEEKADRTIGFMQDALLRYFRQVPHKETKTTEKYALPSGELVYTKAKVDYVRDDDAILAWAKESHPEFVKVEESVRWS